MDLEVSFLFDFICALVIIGLSSFLGTFRSGGIISPSKGLIVLRYL